MIALHPLDNFVVVIQDSAQTEAEAGLVIPEQARERPFTGAVQRVGPKVEVCKPGDRVAFPKYAGSEFEVEGTRLLLIKENELLGVLVEVGS